MAISLTSDSAPAPAALSNGDQLHGDQLLIVEPREGKPREGDRELIALVGKAKGSEVAAGMVAAGGGRKGKRTEYRCAVCCYGIVVFGQAPSCPMCGEARWQQVAWRPFSQLLDDVVVPFGTRNQRLRAPSSPAAEEPIRYLRLGQAGASVEK